MKTSIRTLVVIVMVAMLLATAVTPALAAGFDFEAEIANFSETNSNTKTLKIGETHTPLGSNWMTSPNCKCYISCKGVVSVNDNGVVTAIGEGTAYVAFVASESMFTITYYKVTDNKEPVSNNNSGTEIRNPLPDLMDDDSGVFSFMSVGFAIVKISGILFGAFFVFVIVWMIATARKSKELDNAMNAILSNPCQETVEAATQKFNNVNGLLRFNLSSGSDQRGVHFTMWRNVFNNAVYPSKAIKTETKEALRQALIRLNTHSLKSVVSDEFAKEAAEAFGAGGEDNVWHNLKTMLGCDVYRNVKIYNGATSSEIDAVVVSEDKGIFLLEIKSIGGISSTDGNKVITYNLLKEDPSNQIYRHEADFATYLSDMNIGKKVKNLLVFSWPHGDTRRWLAGGTFPRTDYNIITVEQLIAHFKVQPTVSLTYQERQKIAEKLRTCCKDCVIR